MRLRLICALAATLALATAPAASAQLARADFDSDGFADLAIGAPADSVQGTPGAGAVNILNGSARGLSAYGDEQFTTAPIGIGSAPRAGAGFGTALAAGDLNDDGNADLAIGAPGDDAGGSGDLPASGIVIVLYGSGVGLRPRADANLFSQRSTGVADDAEAGDRFGAALAIADFDGDGRDDLAIGAPGEDVDGQADAGAVHVLYGDPTALTTRGSRFFTQNSPGIKGLAGINHAFGAALAAGDLSRNGRAELAVGIPGGTISGRPAAGAVSVLYGRRGGLSAVDDLWSQDARGIKAFASGGDRFGGALAIGDFDGDRAGDLAVGAPSDSVGAALGAGAVNVIYGSGGGLTAVGDELWTQDTSGIKSRASIGETFGSSLAAGDFSRNGVDDLAIGVPNEHVSGHADAGAVTVLYGKRRGGLGERADQQLTQDSAGINGRAERADRFGEALAAGDLDDDGAADIAVGVPSDSVAGFPEGGAVHALFGGRGGLGGAGDELWTQATAGVKGAPGNDRFGAALASGRP